MKGSIGLGIFQLETTVTECLYINIKILIPEFIFYVNTKVVCSELIYPYVQQSRASLVGDQFSYSCYLHL